MMNKLVNILSKAPLFIAAVIFCGGSLLCSIKLGVAEQHSEFDKWLIGSFVVGMEICKFTFFPLAVNQSFAWSAGLNLIASVLLLVSIVASVAFFETGASNSLMQARASSEIYQSALSDVHSLDAQIASNNRAMETFSRKQNFGTATTNINATLNELRAKRDRALVKLNSVVVSPTSGLHSMFKSVASFLSVSVSSVRFSAYLLAAIIIDVCGIMCLMQLTRSKPDVIDIVAKPDVTHVATTKRNETKKIATTVTQQNQNELARKIKRDIANGVYTENPIMRRVMEAEGIRHQFLKPIVKELENEGVLIKVGKTYQLTESTPDSYSKNEFSTTD